MTVELSESAAEFSIFIGIPILDVTFDSTRQPDVYLQEPSVQQGEKYWLTLVPNISKPLGQTQLWNRN